MAIRTLRRTSLWCSLFLAILALTACSTCHQGSSEGDTHKHGSNGWGMIWIGDVPLPILWP